MKATIELCHQKCRLTQASSHNRVGQEADKATLHWDWNPVRRPKAVTGHGSAGRRPSLGLHWARECRPKAVTGLHWARECRPKAVTGHGSAGRRPSLACTGHGSAGRRPSLACTGAGRRPALACTGGTLECCAAGRRPALAGPKARHCGARNVRAAQ